MTQPAAILDSKDAPHTLRIGFGRYYVTVVSEDMALLDPLSEEFSLMRVRGSGKEAARLELHHAEKGRYKLVRRKGSTLILKTQSRLTWSAGHEILLRFIRTRNDLMWLHAGAAARDGNAVVIVGRQGSGKSTITCGLHDLGWEFLTDEAVPIDPTRDAAMPFPQKPRMRIHPGRETHPDEATKLAKIEPALRPGGIARAARPVRALIFPKFSLSKPAQIQRCPPAEAAAVLLENCMSFTGPRRMAIVKYACALAERIPAYRVTYGDGAQATALAASVLEIA